MVSWFETKVEDAPDPEPVAEAAEPEFEPEFEFELDPDPVADAADPDAVAVDAEPSEPLPPEVDDPEAEDPEDPDEPESEDPLRAVNWFCHCKLLALKTYTPGLSQLSSVPTYPPTTTICESQM